MFKKLLGKYYWPYTIVSMALLVAYFALFIVESSEEVCTEMFQKHRKMFYGGIVERKFINEHQHRAKTVKLLGSEDSISLTFDWDKSGLYDFLSVGDSLYKATNEIEVLVFRKGVVHQFELNYRCHEYR